jgi:3-methyladenine DNA glycosylase AlkD
VDKNKFLKEYRRFLKDSSDPERAKQEKRYLYSDLKHYGVSVWQRRAWVKKHKEELESLSKKEALDWVKFFWSKPYFEERALALNILELHADDLNIKDMPLIEKIMRESKGWAFLDSLIIPLMPGILEKDKKAYDYLKKWIKDDDFWVRRSALLAQLLFFRRGKGGRRKLFFDMAKDAFDESWIDRLYKDSEQKKRARFFIRKAIGWTLREMSIKNPEVAFKFLKENRDKMSGLSFREGSRKLPEKMKKKLV